jgi:hypothetical protein
MRKLILLTCLLLTTLCHAQEYGCFKTAPDKTLELSVDTNVNLSNYDAFFFGEFHGVYGTSEVKLALIKYLNANNGVTDVFMEIGCSAAYLYNQFLATGDNMLFTSPVLIYAQKQPNVDFWQNLYKYNKTAQHKITIRGMDFERAEFLKVLKLLMPQGKEKPLDIYTTLAYIDTVTITDIGLINSEEMVAYNSLYEDIRDEIEANRASYEAYYGANFKTVEEIMFNEDTYNSYGKRNKTMYNNMVKQIELDSIKKFIVFAGLQYGNMAHKKVLCGMLKKNGAFKDHFANISMTCRNCYDWQLKPKYRFAVNRAPYSYYLDTKMMDEIYGKHFNANCKYTLLPTRVVGHVVVKRFSDYIILMKDQGEF